MIEHEVMKATYHSMRDDAGGETEDPGHGGRASDD